MNLEKPLTEGFADSNPFPASLEIYITETLLPSEKLLQHVSQIRSFSQVEDVKYEQETSEFIRKVGDGTSGFRRIDGRCFGDYRMLFNYVDRLFSPRGDPGHEIGWGNLLVYPRPTYRPRGVSWVYREFNWNS